MTLREATPHDAAFVTQLVPRFVEHGVAGGHTRAEVVGGTQRVLCAALERPRPDDLFLIAVDGAGARLGFVYAVTQRDFFTDEAYAHVSEIASARSGDGVGSALMRAVEAWAAQRGYRRITLNVIDENRAGRRFYERLDFKPHHCQLIKHVPVPSNVERR